jgi:hypothetical protein
MLETMPLANVWKELMHGSGECAAKGWTFLTLGIPEWSLLCYIALGVWAVLIAVRKNLIRYPECPEKLPWTSCPNQPRNPRRLSVGLSWALVVLLGVTLATGNLYFVGKGYDSIANVADIIN